MTNMKNIVVATLLIGLFTLTAKAQSDFIQLGSRQYQLLDRLDVLLRTDSVIGLSSVKPFDRKEMTTRALYVKKLYNVGKVQLSKTDLYNLEQILNENFEYSSNIGDTGLHINNIAKSTVWQKPFYWGIKKEEFSFYMQPLLSYEKGNKANSTDKANLFINSRGFIARGTVNKNIGYYTYITENQEFVPAYVRELFADQRTRPALPGVGYIKRDVPTEIGYYNVKGGIMFKAGKYIDVQFANDKVFIGNGYRSLILSDFAENMLFLKVKARFWKFQYYNLWSQLTSTFPLQKDALRPTKYMAMHYLEFQASKKLNIALFENIMMGRQNGIDLNYLNPIISYNAVQAKLGSPDKLTVGLNIKANILPKTQLYGQFVLNEFRIKEIRNWGNGWWGNKQAWQIGVKHYNLFGVQNLDIQAEANLIRPYVYTHYDSATSFTHYNQPLAHPLGANLREFIFITRYQPHKKVNIVAKAFYIEQGQDTGNSNYGSNIFDLYQTRSLEYGVFIGTGVLAKTLYTSLNVTYEILPNLFFDAFYFRRTFSKLNTDANSNGFMVGIRWNLPRREYEF